MKNPSLLTRMSTIRRTRRADSRSPARDAARARRQLGNNHSSDNLSLMEEVLINSQRNSEVSIFMKRNSDVNFLEPDEETTSISSLTKRHKGAIRAIRKLKYLVAKRKFKEALKPYDIKDVIESYSAGHTDLVFKVKGIQTRLDQILGAQGSKAKDVYDSKTSLASKIVNIERQVDSIDEKLQSFIEMYQKDRERIEKEIMCKSESPKVESISDTATGEPDHPMLNFSQETVIENLIDTTTEASSPDSEVNLPTDSLSICSTVTSASHGFESDLKNSIFKSENAFKV